MLQTTPITNALVDAKDADRGRRDSDYSGSDYSDVEERFKAHRRRKSAHNKKMGRRDSDVSDEDDMKAIKAKQRKRTKTLEKIFSNFGPDGALQDGDEPPPSPQPKPSKPARGNVSRRISAIKKRRTSQPPEPQGPVIKSMKHKIEPNIKESHERIRRRSKSPVPPKDGMRRSKSKGRKSLATKPASKRPSSAGRAQKKKVSAVSKKKKKKVASPVDSDEEMDNLWNNHHRKSVKRVALNHSAGDDSDGSDDSGF